MSKALRPICGSTEISTFNEKGSGPFGIRQSRSDPASGWMRNQFGTIMIVKSEVFSEAPIRIGRRSASTGLRGWTSRSRSSPVFPAEYHQLNVSKQRGRAIPYGKSAWQPWPRGLASARMIGDGPIIQQRGPQYLPQ